jgi:hypothetical protein
MRLGTDFTATNSTSVTFTPALSLGDEIELIMGATGAASASSLGELTNVTVSTTDPLITSNPSAVGHLWINSTTGFSYVCNDITINENRWVNTGTGVTGVEPIVPTTGGTITTISGYQIHTFTSSGTFTVPDTRVVEYLVIGGGAGGGNSTGGGGGAGGYRNSTALEMSGASSNPETALTLTAGSYTVTVGAGGAGPTKVSSPETADRGGDGGNSVFSSITANGGGGGSGEPYAGQSGGSGGGGSDYMSVGSAGGSGTSGQGMSGGSGFTPRAGGGGGGAYVAGGVGNNSRGGNGGDGQSSAINGTATTRAGGGAGGKYSKTIESVGATGGSGGGGEAPAGWQSNGGDGVINTGSGGAGSTFPLGGHTGVLKAGNGSSGIVIVRFAI